MELHCMLTYSITLAIGSQEYWRQPMSIWTGHSKPLRSKQQPYQPMMTVVASTPSQYQPLTLLDTNYSKHIDLELLHTWRVCIYNDVSRQNADGSDISCHHFDMSHHHYTWCPSPLSPQSYEHLQYYRKIVPPSSKFVSCRRCWYANVYIIHA